MPDAWTLSDPNAHPTELPEGWVAAPTPVPDDWAPEEMSREQIGLAIAELNRQIVERADFIAQLAEQLI